MSSHADSFVVIEPLIYFPATVVAGSHHLLTFDLRINTPIDQWPYEQEEFELEILIDATAGFEWFPLKKTSLIVARAGTTDGPAHFLLQAPLAATTGDIAISLVSAYGVPLKSYLINTEVTSDAYFEGEAAHQLRTLINFQATPSIALLSDILADLGSSNLRAIFEWYTECASYLVNRDPREIEEIHSCLWDHCVGPQLSPNDLSGQEPLLWNDRFHFLLRAQLLAAKNGLPPEVLMTIGRLQTVMGVATIDKVLRNIWAFNSLISAVDYPWYLVAEGDADIPNARMEPWQAVLCSDGRPCSYSLANDHDSLVLLQIVHTSSVKKSLIAGAA